MLRKSLKVLVVALFFFTTFANAEKAELRRHTVMADGHPIALWEKSAAGATESILLVHGRTWSALPDFDLWKPPFPKLTVKDKLLVIARHGLPVMQVFNPVNF